MILNMLIAISLTQPLLVAHAPVARRVSPDIRVAGNYGASRGIFVIKGATCDSSSRCLIIKASKVNRQLRLNIKENK